MSPGKKAFIVLKLILEFSDSKIPVLIDQPKIAWIIGQYIMN